MSEQVADLGEAAWTAIDVDPVLVEPRARGRIRRRDLAARALVLRSRGALQREIAAALGVSRSYAAALAGEDPLGEKAERRKRGYAGTCEVCGGPTSGADGRDAAAAICAKCEAIRLHDERHWTRETVLDALRSANTICEATLGRSIRAADWVALAPSYQGRFSPARYREAVEFHDAIQASGLRLPPTSVIAREVGGFRGAAETLGLPILNGGGSHHRELARRPRLVDETTEPQPPAAEASGFRPRRVPAGTICPSCGGSTSALDDRTGWCRACTRESAAS